MEKKMGKGEGREGRKTSGVERQERKGKMGRKKT